jgi:L-ribulose-5-phosphate 3-epimerase
VRIGMVGRFFPLNWRPPADEVRFARSHGFDVIQIRSDRAGAIEDDLRADLDEVAAAFAAASVEPTLEMLVRHEGERRTIPRALEANLDAIRRLGISRVHVHPVGRPEVESLLADELAEALELATDTGLVFGVEHNAPSQRLLVDPRALLEAVPGLHLVWDVNHTVPELIEPLLALAPRFSLVHVSDTPLPETNHHLPLGRGSVDLAPLARLDVPLVLEIGGLPLSGGYGLDTDEALLASREQLLSLAEAS